MNSSTFNPFSKVFTYNDNSFKMTAKVQIFINPFSNIPFWKLHLYSFQFLLKTQWSSVCKPLYALFPDNHILNFLHNLKKNHDIRC